MRFLASAGVGVACLGIVLVLSSAGAKTANAGQVADVPMRRTLPQIPRQSRSFIHRNAASPTPCSSDAGADGDFVGIPDGDSIGGAVYSAVLGGATNLACAEGSTIGGGFSNVDSAGGAQSAFIGGGQSNATFQQDDFIGAGSYNISSGYDSLVGAGSTNTASGDSSGIVSGYLNVVAGDESFVGAGFVNSVSGSGSFIGGGDYAYYTAYRPSAPGNQISANDAFIGAGDQNAVAGSESFIGAGSQNAVNGSQSFVGGGNQNNVAASEAFIGGGLTNTITSGGTNGVIAGGVSNYVSAQKGTIGGGESNLAEGSFAVVPGGYHDEALGNESFAAGAQAHARYTGSFVWSDYVSGESPLADSRAGEFVARASGGVYFFSNAAASAGVHLAAGSGAWASLSDRNAKIDIVPLDDASILAKVASLPVSAWRYKTESGVRHVGPMAQDFYAAFGVGEDDRHITSIDEDGIALAAIKALHREVAASNESNRALRDQNGRLASRLNVLEADVRALLAHQR